MKNYVARCAEVDWLIGGQISEIVREGIEAQIVDQDAYDALLETEADERAELQRLADR